MARLIEQRKIDYSVVGDVLVRDVTLADGRTYTHRCSKKVFEEVCFYIEEHSHQGLTLGSIAEAIDAPYTQVNVVLELLKDRGMVEVRGRRSYMAMDCVHIHAMVEFYALAEGVAPTFRPTEG